MQNQKKAVLPPWEGGFVWEKNKKSDVWAGVSCEHLGASFWWPCKDYQQDEPDSMSLNFEVAQPYKVVSNGTKVAETITYDNYNRFSWKVANPINPYNATFYIGNYTRLQQDYLDITGKTQKLQFYVMPYNEKEALKYFSFSAEVLKFYENTFGEYPFWKDGFKLVESPFQGMEHQSAIAIGDGFRKKEEENSEGYDYIEDDYLIIHETAHEWWGNSVSAFDMSDAWLQEGFATYSEYLFIENKYGSNIFIKELNQRRNYILDKWPMLGTRGVNDNPFIGSDIYHKGALLLQNIRSTLGKDPIFFSILKGFAVDNKFKTVSTEDFLAYVNSKSGLDFTALFHVYLKTLNTPTLEYDLKISEFGYKELTYRWTKVPEGFSMPFAVKTNRNSFKKIEATTNWQTINFTAGENFNFFGSSISYKGSPAHFYSHFNTISKGM